MKYLVIGGNAGGMSFAAKMKRNSPNDEIVILEKRDYISFGGCGLPYYIGGQFDNENRMFARKPDEIISLGIDLRVNSVVTNVDTENNIVHYKKNNEQLTESYDKLIVASGSRARQLPNVKGDNSRISSLLSFEDGKKIKTAMQNNDNKKIGIIGAGFIGLEVMENIKELNKEVVLIESTNNVMGNKFSNEILEDVPSYLKENGVEAYFETFVEEVEGFYDKVIIKTNKGNIEVDYLIVSIGFVPNTEFIDIEKFKGVIKTDKNCKTNIDNIYAVGDCALSYNKISDDMEYLPLATTANKQGRNLADYFAFGEANTNFDGMLGSSSVKFFDMQLARTGLSEETAKKYFKNVKSKVIKDKNQTSYYKGQEDIKVKIVYNADNFEILGAEMIGKKDVVLRIDVLAGLIHMKATTKQLGYIDFCYSPPFARTWDVLNVAGNVIK